MDRALVRSSKFLSLVLRHAPETIGLRLDAEGWANVHELLELANAAGHPLSEEVLRQVVAHNDKRRFALSADGTRIRASQGHSIVVDLGLVASVPPALLYHGTARANVDSILELGLVRGSRNHVHLSLDVATAKRVGQRHGSPVVFEVDARGLHQRGSEFYLSENGVWLTDHVPKDRLRLV
jgi:putative RNA 2'-phosphotransferase